MEVFAKPGVGGIIEKKDNGKSYILMQERVKKDAPNEAGLLEIPAGKIREFENIYDCLRREIWEETGLKVTWIDGEESSEIVQCNGYRVLSYEPFSSNQNLEGEYPIMVQIFICRAEGDIIQKTDESENVRWVSLEELEMLLENSMEKLYPMHVTTLRKYIKLRRE